LGYPTCDRGVALPCEASWELDYTLVSYHLFATQGAKGREEYPYHWLGGAGEVLGLAREGARRKFRWSSSEISILVNDGLLVTKLHFCIVM